MIAERLVRKSDCGVDALRKSDRGFDGIGLKRRRRSHAAEPRRFGESETGGIHAG